MAHIVNYQNIDNSASKNPIFQWAKDFESAQVIANSLAQLPGARRAFITDTLTGDAWEIMPDGSMHRLERKG